MLIASPRHSRADLAAWARWERIDRALGKTARLQRLEDDAIADVLRWWFAADPCGACDATCAHRGYAGLSMGKDSTVLMGVLRALHRRHGVSVPVVWVRVEPIANPDCVLVRDALSDVVRDYSEVVSWCSRDDRGWHASGTLERGFDEFVAARLLRHRHASGIRGDESGIRALRVAAHGTVSANTCAPLARWTGTDVFAYLAREDLPVHPAYACSFGGALDRTRLRVSSLGGQRGSGHGRTSWETHYYGEEMTTLGYR